MLLDSKSGGCITGRGRVGRVSVAEDVLVTGAKAVCLMRWCAVAINVAEKMTLPQVRVSGEAECFIFVYRLRRGSTRRMGRTRSRLIVAIRGWKRHALSEPQLQAWRVDGRHAG